MVYCGKASEGCQSCRKRRIKCDKIRPECSQCIRQSKKCPGYRDQLSLMFRDESTKVIQKAHAQWGQGGHERGDASRTASQVPDYSLGPPSYPPTTDGLAFRMSVPLLNPSHAIATSPTIPSGSEGLTSPSNGDKSLVTGISPSTATMGRSAARAAEKSDDTQLAVKQEPTGHPLQLTHIRRTIHRNMEERGVDFYMDHYLLGLPDEPKSHRELNSSHWCYNTSLRHIMAAIGLVGLSNLTNNSEMMGVARERYGQALRETGQLIQPGRLPSLEVTMRSVIMLALFEVVKGTHHGQGTVQAHIMGGTALVRSWIPLPNVPLGGVRTLIHLVYSTFISMQLMASEVPSHIFDCISTVTQLQHEIDRPATRLAIHIIRYLQLYAFAEKHVLSDGKAKTSNVVLQLLDIDAELAAWPSSLRGDWVYKMEEAPHLPPKAIFKGQYHVYVDIMTARTWNFYRWSRILVNQMLLDLIDKNPVSSLPLISAAKRCQMLRANRRLAKDMLTSTASHWRHPLLDQETGIMAQNGGGGGAGAASGVPALLFQLKVASCAPGVPMKYWQWALEIMQAIWGTTGILYARTIMEAMRAHRDNVHRSGAEGVLGEDLLQRFRETGKRTSSA